MLSQRVLVVVVLLPLWVGLLFWGTVPFAFFMALVLVLAAREYGLLFQAGGYRPAAGILMLGVAGLAWAHIGDRWTAPGCWGWSPGLPPGI
jgi:phosphatidate cytidylyltransferase